MRKLIILVALLTAGGVYSQCRYRDFSTPSTVSATFTGGTAKTMDFELAYRINFFHIGAGVGVMVDNVIQYQGDISYTRNDFATFISSGVDFDKLHVGLRMGRQTKVYVTGTVAGVRQHIPQEQDVMVGCLVGYSVKPRIRVNVGYDTFNKLNFGLTFGL